MSKFFAIGYGIFFIFSLLDAYGQVFSSFNDQATESYGDQLIIGYLKDDQFPLNPFEIRSAHQKEIIQLIFGYGLRKTPDKIAKPPDLVTRSSASRDFITWRIVLNRNISFHNDVYLRNSDVKFTFELVKKYGGYILSRPLNFDNVQAIDTNGDLEVTFTLKSPDRNFLDKLADIPILPRDYYLPVLSQGYGMFSELKPLGMGPFRFDYQLPNVLMLVFHPHYYTGRPFLDRIRIQFFPDERALVDALVNGDVDYIELPDRVTTDRLRELMSSRLVVFTVPRSQIKVHTLLFNVNVFPLSEPEVRRAIFRAINRQQMVTRFMQNVGTVANTLIPDTSVYYERSLYEEKYSPKEALEILRRAGWRLNRRNLMLEKNGRPLSFKLYFSQNSELELSIARTIKINLAELNINVQPIPLPAENKSSLLEVSDYQSMLYSYTYDPRYLFHAFSDFYFEVLGADQRVPNYRNRYLSRLYKLVYDIEEKHVNFYQRFQIFAVDQKPALFLFFDEKIIIGLDKRFEEFRTIVNIDRRQYFRLNPLENWFVPKEAQKY